MGGRPRGSCWPGLGWTREKVVDVEGKTELVVTQTPALSAGPRHAAQPGRRRRASGRKGRPSHLVRSSTIILVMAAPEPPQPQQRAKQPRQSAKPRGAKQHQQQPAAASSSASTAPAPTGSTTAATTPRPVANGVAGGGGQPAKLKLVVRRLPPNLPEAVLWKTVEPWVSDATAGWRAFRPGKLAKE